MEDYLDEDPVIDNQRFICLSLFKAEKKLTKENVDTYTKGSSRGAFKIRGAFRTMEEANKHAKMLEKIDPHHSIFIGEMGKWHPFDPSVEESGEEIYSNDELNELMKTYKENREKCEEMHRERTQRERVKQKQKVEDDDTSDVDLAASLNRRIEELTLEEEKFKQEEKTLEKKKRKLQNELIQDVL